MVGKRSVSTKEYEDHAEDHNDLENGKPQQPQKYRFKDIAHVAIEDSRTRELKKALREGIEHDRLEKFRKTDEEVRKQLCFYAAVRLMRPVAENH